MENENLQSFTKLPIRVIQVADKWLPDIIVRTPHKGDVVIPTKEEHYPFLFGTVTQIDRHTDKIIKEILELENESRDYLLNKWLKAN